MATSSKTKRSAYRAPAMTPGFLPIPCLISLLALAACGGPTPEGIATSGTAEQAGQASEAELRARAEQLAHEILIVDTHVDVPYRLAEAPQGEMDDISQRTEGGDFDYPRARQGGLDAPFMSIYVPAAFQETGGAKEHADKLIDLVESFETDHPDKFAVAHSPRQVREIVAAGKIALPMGMENGAPVEGDLANLEHFHRRGIRYITLTHSENNHIADSSYAEEKKWEGLSDFGREVVREMNRLGIMVDVSHISDAAFDDVLEVTTAPVIASHSSCRAFTPGWERNMSDEMIRRLAEAGGVLQINFGSAFLKDDIRKQSEQAWAEIGRYMEEHGLERGSEEARAYVERYRAEHPSLYADITDVADHIDHVVELVGVDHVGFGSDFDGVGDSLPTGLKSVADYPNLIYELLRRGYSEEDVRKIAGENLMRVWSEVERVAAEMQGGEGEQAGA